MPEVARFYGLQINRSGMALCPFHEEKTPSLKIYDDHYYCFGCGESGDCTGFVAKLFGISQKESAKKKSYDFGLHLFDDREIAVPVNGKLKAEKDYHRWIRNSNLAVSEYLTKLTMWRKQYIPQNPGESLHPLFVESLTKSDYVQYLSNTLTYGFDKEKRQLYESCREDIMKIRERLDQIAAKERPIKRKYSPTI